MPKAFYVGWLNHQNLGDEACFYAIRNLLEPDVTVEHLADHKILDCCDLPDVFILGGGTLLHPGLDLRMGMIHKMLTRGCPVSILGSGLVVEPRMNGLGHEMSPHVYHCLNMCHPVGVRGPLTLKRLRDSMFHGARVIGDPAMLLNPPDGSQEYSRNSNRIAINIGNTANHLYGMSEEYVTEEIAKLVKMLSGWEIFYVPLWDRDVPYLEKLKELTGIGEVVPWNESPYELMKFFRTCYCVIGEKLHSVVLAAAAGVPAVSISYWEKCIDFMSSIDLQDFCVKTGDKNLALELKKRFDLVENRLEEIVNKMSRKKQEFLGLHLWAASEVKKIARGKK